MEHSGFPSDETLAAFIDGRLDDVTRRRVIEHMTTCDECYAVYLAATEMQSVSAAPPPRRRRMSGTFLAATLTMSIAAVLILVLFTPLGHFFTATPLVAAAGKMPYRTIEGRLSGGFAWKPLREIPRDKPVDVQHDPDKWDLLKAGVDAKDKLREKPTPENLHAVGASHLLLGNFDEAIAALKSASEQRPHNADFANDLAAAYLARGAYKDRQKDFADAFEVVTKAWALKKSPEIAWTRAVTLEHLHLPDARTAWNDYLALDPSSQWSDEAREHLRALAAPPDAYQWNRVRPDVERAAREHDRNTLESIATQFPQQVSALGEELLTRWAARVDGGAQPFRRTPRSLDDARDDESDLDAARAIGDVMASRGFGALRATIAAPLDRESIVALARGRQLKDDKDFGGADEALRTARERALRVHSPIAQLASLELAASAFSQNDYDTTNEHLDIAEQEFAAASWHSSAAVVRARIHWLRGLALIELGHPHEALKNYEEALALMKQCGHRTAQAKLNALVAQSHDALGDSDDAWQYRVEGLRIASRLDPTCLQYVLVEATVAAVIQHRPALSETLTNRMIVVAMKQDGGFLGDAHIWRARALRDAGPDALRELRDARVAAEQIPDADARGRAVANIDMATGDVLAAVEPERAIPPLSAALQFLDARGNHLLRAEAFDARARAYERVARRELASRDRESAIEEIEAQRGGIEDLRLRALFVRLARKVYTDAIELAVASRDDVRAFDLAERSRATTAGVAPAMSVERLQQILPAGVALVEYTALPRKTVAWIVRREGVTATILPTDSKAISAATERMVAARTDRRSFDAAAAELYARIVARLRPRLRDVQTVAFVPDPSWTRVPFAALVDPASGHHLFEDMEVVTDASAAHFALALQKSGRASGSQHMLVCADPDADNAPRLLAARREGDLIGRTFSGASILSGSAATREEFVAKAPSATVIHFGGHAENDAHDADSSALLFSGEGKLYAWEIRKLKLARTRLVVLAACDSSAISDAFLAAGAPATIATIWAVGDVHSNALMTKLYQQLHDGDSPSHALRAAQLAVLHDPGARPVDWAGFELAGL
ncbi:MAG TPA: CHAT domain-containing protein [Thermoanaerobaculia bacterium]|nr:CHAT domain-containing protein [Thermoanaerobaculia bacterium]